MSAGHERPGQQHQRRDPVAWALLQAALSYAAAGWRVFPLRPNTKKPFGDTRGFLDATTDIEQVRAWWTRWPRANIGIATGNGLVVIDEDTYKGADAAAWAMLPVTLTSQSARGGRHWFFGYPESLPSVPEGKLAPGICIKATGGYVVVEPSTFQGKQYQWIDRTQAIAQLPERVAELIRATRPEPRPIHSGPVTPNASDAQHWLDAALAKTGPGEGDKIGYLLAQQLIANGVADVEGTLAIYADRATLNPRDPFTDRDIQRWIRSAQGSDIVKGGEPARSQSSRVTPLRKPTPPTQQQQQRTDGTAALHDDNSGGDEPPEDPETPGREHLSDMGNARRFVRLHGQETRYVAAWGQWLIWDSTRWRKDENGHIMRLAKDTARHMWDEISSIDDDDEREKAIKWCARSESDSKLKAMLSQVESEPEIALVPSQLDAWGWLLNTPGGTVDLKTGKRSEPQRTHLFTKRSEASYDPAATCDTWDRFLDTTFAGDAELISYVQRAVGYSLTADVSEQCVFVLHGSGANGKSTFLETLTRALGDYAMTTPTDTLMVKNGQSIPSDVARLMGARFVAASESGDGRRLDEELVKRISGGDRMSARFMHHDWFEFHPVLKLWLAVNHRPTIRGTDNGIWRRIHLIPFAVTIPPERQDKQLPAKLLAEAPGILAWAVRGCLAWQREGLNPPKIVQDATAEYRTDMDAIGRFLGECCVTEPGAVVTAKAIYDAYKSWCAENGEREQSQTRLGVVLRERGFRKDYDGRKTVIWHGVGLTTMPVQGTLA